MKYSGSCISKSVHGCRKKGTLIVDRIMAARYKERRIRNMNEALLGRKDTTKYNYEELSTLELELSNMYEELEKSLDNPYSALRSNCLLSKGCLKTTNLA